MTIRIILLMALGGSLLLHASPVRAQSATADADHRQRKTVMLDRYFNSETRKDSAGKSEFFHYTWDQTSNAGFSELGDIFISLGANLSSLDVAPTPALLRKSSVYIIVDPDHVKDNPHPNFVSPVDASIIAAWVKSGGVLLLLGNDSANCDLDHFNLLAGKFGIHFSNHTGNQVLQDQFESGAILTDSTHPIFGVQKLFLKDISLLELMSPARSVVAHGAKTIMAMANFGKGKVFAIGDPWLYNEYIDHRRLPESFTNRSAATRLATWLLATGTR